MSSGFRLGDHGPTSAGAIDNGHTACPLGSFDFEQIEAMMAATRVYETNEPSRANVDALDGPTVIEFGTPWCGHCAVAQPLIEEAFAGHPDVRHIKIEDGPGRPLGRSFRVKLWPTLVFLRGGRELGRVVRPRDGETIAEQLQLIDGPSAESDSRAG